MLKKGYLLVLFILTTTLLTANAEEAPWWINQAQAWESNGVIYAVGSALYRPDYNDQAYLASFRQVTATDINKIKSFLGLSDRSLIGFQVISVYYTYDSFYLLGAAPRSANVQNIPQPTAATTPPSYQPAPGQNRYAWISGPDIFEANVQNINMVCAVGYGKINPAMQINQQGPAAIRAATVDSQFKIKKHLNLSGVLRGFRVVDTYFKGNDAWALGCAPQDQ